MPKARSRSSRKRHFGIEHGCIFDWGADRIVGSPESANARPAINRSSRCLVPRHSAVGDIPMVSAITESKRGSQLRLSSRNFGAARKISARLASERRTSPRGAKLRLVAPDFAAWRRTSLRGAKLRLVAPNFASWRRTSPRGAELRLVAPSFASWRRTSPRGAELRIELRLVAPSFASWRRTSPRGAGLRRVAPNFAAWRRTSPRGADFASWRRTSPRGADPSFVIGPTFVVDSVLTGCSTGKAVEE
jgi:hypothetical protein